MQFKLKQQQNKHFFTTNKDTNDALNIIVYGISQQISECFLVPYTDRRNINSK